MACGCGVYTWLDYRLIRIGACHGMGPPDILYAHCLLCIWRTAIIPDGTADLCSIRLWAERTKEPAILHVPLLSIWFVSLVRNRTREKRPIRTPPLLHTTANLHTYRPYHSNVQPEPAAWRHRRLRHTEIWHNLHTSLSPPKYLSRDPDSHHKNSQGSF